MLGKLENGNLKVARGKVLKVHQEETIQIPHTTIDEETGKETTTYTEETVVKEYAVANPRDEDFIAAGYKEVVEGKKLKEKEGFYQSPVYTEEDDKIKVSYEYKECIEDDEG